MREFRVWCKNRKEWETHSCYLGQNGNLSHLDNNMQLHPLNPETHIVQFYTGKNDIDGKKIYEGDIMDYNGIDLEVAYNNIFLQLGGMNIMALCNFKIVGNKFESSEI